jgi:hypothetical protein
MKTGGGLRVAPPPPEDFTCKTPFFFAKKNSASRILFHDTLRTVSPCAQIVEIGAHTISIEINY